ncbi:MAG: M1 family metallopeptidase [Polyangiaceae bacterium]|nr:M1 family metallopeptidase [Polyangiaceae bacterium]
MRRLRPLALAALSPLLAAGCGPADSGPRRAPPPPFAMAPALPGDTLNLAPLPPEAPPLGRLPPGVRPTHYTLVLEVVPERDGFAGTVEIAVELDQPRAVVWMDAEGLTARRASVRPEGAAPVGARLEQVEPTGVAALRLDRPVGPGKATIRIDYDGAFNRRGEGLYTVRRGGKAYAFTQNEATGARLMFPSFDEPAYKTPFDVSLFVPRGEAAIANAAELERVSATPALDRVTFATTAPLPTYLVAIAVGPLDVVSAPPVPASAIRPRPLPLRGVAAAGRGPELAHALAGTAAIVTALEGYFGVAYPYDKLDVIAVPEKQGAMENPGAVTFSEWLLLVDGERAPAAQRRGFAAVTAHELAHIWFGDLVTMPWWDDLWLKEASATWMAGRTVTSLWPDLDDGTWALEAVHGAMDSDGLVSARKIRQEILSHHDIANAYDGITYQKGSGVISMIERWLGPSTYQRGVQKLMADRRFGTADVNDLMVALSAAAGRDVAGPFRSFLDQPGVPLVEASLSCDGPPALELRQSRYLPVGSAGEASRRWQIPVCSRYPVSDKEVRESCALLSGQAGELKLDTPSCPAWVMPNADGAGYYRWSVPAAALKALTAASARLSARERVSLAESVDADFRRGALTAADAFNALAPLARDRSRAVARAPMDLLRDARRWLEDDPARAAVEAYARKLYGDAYKDLGWDAPAAKKPAKGAPARAAGEGAAPEAEPADRALLRREVIELLAFTAEDPAVRAEAAARGRAYVKGGALHPEAVHPDLVGAALAVAAQEGDAAFFDGLVALLDATEDEVARTNLLRAIGSVRAPDLAARARALSLDPRLRSNEGLLPIHAQLSQPETREATWQWLAGNLDSLIARLPYRSVGGLPWLAARFCDRAHADAASQLFGARVQALEGGPRNLAGALEVVNLCTAVRRAQSDSLRAFFTAAPPRAAAPPPKKKR